MNIFKKIALMGVCGLIASPVFATSLTGTVIVDEESVDGATVTLLQGDSQVASTSTDSVGQYSFDDVPNGSYNIQVISGSVDNGAASVTVGENDLVHNIWLVTEQPVINIFTVSGQVVDLSGNAYGNNTGIRFSNLETNQSFNVNTDSDGNYTQDLPEGEYALRVNVSESIDTDNDTSPDFFLNATLDGTLPNVVVIADDTVDLTLPLKNVDIDTFFEGEEVESFVSVNFSDSGFDDDTSRFFSRFFNMTINFVDDESEIRLPAGVDFTLVAEATQLPDAIPTPQAVLLQEDETFELIEVDLATEGVRFIFESTDLLGNPLNDEFYTFFDQETGVRFSGRQSNSADSRVIRTTVPNGNYSVNVTSFRPDWSFGFSSSQFNFDTFLALTANSSEGLQQVAVDVVLPLYPLSGTVTDEEGNPIENVVVSMPRTTEFVTYDSGRTGNINVEHGAVFTNANGEYELYVSTHADRVQYSAPFGSGLVSQSIDINTIPLGGPQDVILLEQDVTEPEPEPEPEPGDELTLSGTVTSFSGIAVANARVNVFDTSFNTVANVNADENGVYSAEVPNAGTYIVQISNGTFTQIPASALSSPFFFVRTSGFSVETDTTRDFVIPFIPITGMAMNEAGEPLLGITFRVDDFTFTSGASFDFQQMRVPVVSAVSGMFTTSALPGFTDVDVASTAVPLDELSASLAAGINESQHFDIIYLGSPTLVDTDENGLFDFYEQAFFRGVSPDEDFDSDNLTALQEMAVMSSINTNDTDQDGVTDDLDSFPVLASYQEPYDTSVDSDNDGFTDLEEFIAGTDPNNENDFIRLLADFQVADANLQACINSYAGNATFVSQITTLFCNFNSIESLEGLQAYTNLQTLLLAFNDIDDADLVFIENLTNLESLDLRNTQVTDVTFLESFTKLADLDIGFTSVTDISFLSGLSALTSLAIDGLNLTSLAAIEGLTQLTRLEMSGGSFDLSFLNDFVNLTNLQIYGTSETELGFLNNMSSLTFLTLSSATNAPFGEVTRIGNLTSLTGLSLSGTPLNNVDFLSTLVNLEFIDAGSTGISDIDGLAGLENLDGVFLSSNNIDNINALRGLTLLERLVLSGNNIQSLLPLSGAVALQYLQVDSNPILSLAPINTLPLLSQVGLGNNPQLTCLSIGEAVSFPAVSGLPASCFDIPEALIPDFATGELIRLDDLNNDNIDDIGIYFIDSVGAPTLQVLDGATLEEITRVVWDADLTNTSVHVFDADNDGDADVGVFGTRSNGGYRFFVRDIASGERTQIFNWPGNWTNASLKVLDDLNDDGYPEVALEGTFTNGNRPQLVARNGATGSGFRTYGLPDILTNPQWFQHADQNADGAGDIATFGRITRNNRIQVRVTNSANASQRFQAYNFPDLWTDIEWVRLSDSNNDGEDEWGLFGILRADQRPQLISRNGAAARGSRINFAWPGDFTNAEFISVPDTSGNGVDEVAVAGLRTNTNRYQLSVKEGADRSNTLRNYNWPNNWTDVSFELLQDLNGDGAGEVALYGIRDENMEIIIRNGATGQPLSGANTSLINMGNEWSVKPTLILDVDVNGDDVADVMAYGVISGEATIRQYDGVTGELLN